MLYIYMTLETWEMGVEVNDYSADLSLHWWLVNQLLNKMSKTLTFLVFSFCDGECFIDLLACIQDYMDTKAGSVRLPGWFNTVRNLSFGKDWPF